MLRRIHYIDPYNNANYTFLTNKMEIPAYQLVIIYKHFWNIERVLYHLNSKMQEQKSWASSAIAEQHHPTFKCLVHNLCMLMDEQISCKGLKSKIEEKKAKEHENSSHPPAMSSAKP